jgi:TPR repeat protein
MKAGGGCRTLALRFQTSDPKRIPLLEKACVLGDGIGCMGLGAAYLHGNQGAPKDAKKAKEALTKACTLGEQSSCERVAQLP